MIALVCWYFGFTIMITLFFFLINYDCVGIVVFWYFGILVFWYAGSTNIVFVFCYIWIKYDFVCLLVFWIYYYDHVFFGSIMIVLVCWYFGILDQLWLCLFFVMFGSIMIVIVCWYFGFTIMIAIFFLNQVWLCWYVGIWYFGILYQLRLCLFFVMFWAIMIVLVCWYFGFTIMIAFFFIIYDCVGMLVCWYIGVLVFWYFISAIIAFVFCYVWINYDYVCLLVFWIYYYDHIVCVCVCFDQLWLCWYVDILVYWYIGMLVCCYLIFWYFGILDQLWSCLFFVIFGSIKIVFVCWYFGFTIMIVFFFS